MTDVTLNREDLLAAIVTAGRTSGNGDKAAVAALRAAAELGQTKEDFETFRNCYVAGCMGGMFGWTTKAAVVWMEDTSITKRVAKGETPTPFQRAYATFRMRFSRIKEAAGFEKDAAKARAPKGVTTAVPVEPEANLATVASLVVNKAENLETVLAQLDEVAAYLARLQNANAAILTGDAGSAARDAIAAFRANLAKAVPAAKPLPQAEPKPAKAEKAAKPEKAAA